MGKQAVAARTSAIGHCPAAWTVSQGLGPVLIHSSIFMAASRKSVFCPNRSV
jgi:hypothetical protein